MSSTLQKLEALPKPQYRKSVPWPKRPKQSLTKDVAERFASLVSTCEGSLVQLLESHPELPQYDQLDNWRRRNPWFNDLWKHAQRKRADFLAERCAQLALDATPKTAHVVRVRFDVARWLCSRFHPEVYGDKPQQQQQTTVNVGVSISPERLSDIRAKLDDSRSAFLPPSTNGTRTKPGPKPQDRSKPPWETSIQNSSNDSLTDNGASTRNTPNGCADSGATREASNPDPTP